jgi:hypothetical protein
MAGIGLPVANGSALTGNGSEELPVEAGDQQGRMYPMRISKMSLIGAAVVLGSCVAVGALAQAQPGGGRQGRGQGRGGFGQGRFGGGQMTLLNVPMDLLVKELKLTDDQKTAITAVQTKERADLQALRQPPADGSQPDRQAMCTKMTEIQQKAAKDAEAVLKDDQKTDATALLKNLQALQAVRIPYQTYGDLKLTAEQKTKLAALAADITKDRAAKQKELVEAQQAGDQAKVREIFTAMRGNGQPDEKATAILTADQKEVVTKYIKDHPAPAGGGRRFGPGAGGAPPPQL